MTCKMLGHNFLLVLVPSPKLRIKQMAQAMIADDIW